MRVFQFLFAPFPRSLISFLTATVENFLCEHALADKKICIALSGGVDSVVLLDTVVKLRPTHNLEVEAIHIHHGLSPNADKWASFCEERCNAAGVALATLRVTVKQGNATGLEAAARTARYTAFALHGARLLLLAQHADDQAETVLHQLLRGTGLKGLSGMGAVRRVSSEQTIFRPLLTVTREDITTTAATRGLTWIEDESNLDTQYTRNFLRAEIMPRLAERFPHYRASLARAAHHASDADELLENLAKIDLRFDGEHAEADLLDALPRKRQSNALYHWLRWQGVTNVSQQQIESWVEQLFRPAPVSKPQQAGGHNFIITRRKNRLQLTFL